MKKILSFLITNLILLTSLMASEFVIEEYDFYAGIGASIETFTNHDIKTPGMALVLTAGVPIYKNTSFLEGVVGGEIEFSKSIVPMVGTGYLYEYEADYTNIGLYATYTYLLSDSFFIKPRFGVVYSSGDYKANGCSGFSCNINNQVDTGPTISLLGGYILNDSADIVFGFNNIELSQNSNSSSSSSPRYFQVGISLFYHF